MRRKIIFYYIVFFLSINFVFAKENDLNKYYKLALHYLYVNEDSSLSFCNLAYDLAVQNDDAVKEAEILLIKSELLRFTGQNEEITQIYNTVKEIAKNTGNRKLLASSYILKAKNYIDFGFYEKAYHDLNLAHVVYSKLNDSNGMANVFMQYGNLCYLERNLDDALRYYNLALSYVENSDDKYIQIGLKSNISNIYFIKGSLDTAKLILKKCINEILENKINYRLDRLYINFSLIFLSYNDIDSALHYIDLSIQIASNSSNKLTLSNALVYKGAILLTKGEYSEALLYFKRAENIAQIQKMDNIRVLSLDYITQVYKKQGDYKNAYQYHIKFKNVSDTLHQRQKLANTERLKIDKNEEIVKINKIYIEKSTHQQIIFSIIVFILLVSTVTLLIIYKSERKIRKIQADILAQELEQSNKKIITKNIYLQQKNEVLFDIANKLNEARHRFSTQNQSIIQEAINALKTTQKSDNWDEFEVRFEQVHLDFFHNLNKRCSSLTQNEKRLCAYLSLNMTTKEVATLTHNTVRAVEQARYRLRKKMNIPTDIDLVAFIEEFKGNSQSNRPTQK